MKTKKTIVGTVVIFLIVNMLASPNAAIEAARGALELCANVLIPSLLPFFVFSSILIRLGFANLIARPMSHVMRPFFGVSGAGALCFVLGIVSGYPMGAACVCDMYESGVVDRREGEKLLAFCNNSGPLFVIGSVGCSMYMSRDIGVMLYIVHILSALSVGIVLGLFGRKKEHSYVDKMPISCSRSVGVIIKEAVFTSVNNMLTVCAFTVIFALVINAVSELARNELLSLLIGGFAEISGGVYNVSVSSLPIAQKLMLTSGVMGFAGVSVHLQVAGIVSRTKLSLKPYLIGKSLQTLASVFFSWVLLYLLPMPAAVNGYYPIMPYEVINFAAAFKLAMLYITSIAVAVIALWLFEKICAWQERVKRRGQR